LALLVVQGESGILLHGGAEDQGHGVVQQALAEDQAVQGLVHVQILKGESVFVIRPAVKAVL
jgi:hypothetical protein